MELLDGSDAKKGFPSIWIEWIMQVVRNGKVGINLNGKPRNYFRTYKGLRQGDPLSPLLFNLVGDALDAILTKAKEGGHIRGLVPQLINGGSTHLQYADDTIILIELDDEVIANTKFLLYCFESMSGLKINYDNNEVIVVGAPEEEKKRVANMLNCQEGNMPIKYLGVPISDRQIHIAELRYVNEKVKTRLPGWQRQWLSSAGKSILMETSLSSIPNYVMGVYYLQEGIHHRMDTDRADFF